MFVCSFLPFGLYFFKTFLFFFSFFLFHFLSVLLLSFFLLSFFYSYFLFCKFSLFILLELPKDLNSELSFYNVFFFVLFFMISCHYFIWFSFLFKYILTIFLIPHFHENRITNTYVNAGIDIKFNWGFLLQRLYNTHRCFIIAMVVIHTFPFRITNNDKNKYISLFLQFNNLKQIYSNPLSTSFPLGNILLFSGIEFR